VTIKEAQLFFPHEESDQLIDLYEDRLFEYKQFFLSKAPIRKVFVSKMDKLKQMEEAYFVLSNSEVSANSINAQTTITFSDEVLKAFTQWELFKSQFKQQLMLSNDGQSIIKTVTDFLSVVDLYHSKWYTDEEIDIEIETLSKDPDPMYVLEAIKDFNSQGGVYFDDILKMNTNSFLLKEMKRLSLLSKKYGDVGSI